MYFLYDNVNRYDIGFLGFFLFYSAPLKYERFLGAFLISLEFKKI